jgi:hypothetical protein
MEGVMTIEQIKAGIQRYNQEITGFQDEERIVKAEKLSITDVSAAYEMISKIVSKVQRIIVTIIYALASSITLGLVPMIDLAIKMIRSVKVEKRREAIDGVLIDLRKKILDLTQKMSLGQSSLLAQIELDKQAEVEKQKQLLAQQESMAEVNRLRAAQKRKVEERNAQEDESFNQHIIPMINASIKPIGVYASTCDSSDQLDEMREAVARKVEEAQGAVLRDYVHYSDRIKAQIRAKFDSYKSIYMFVLGCKVNVEESIRLYVEDFDGKLAAGESIPLAIEGFKAAASSSRDVQLLELDGQELDTTEQEKFLRSVFSAKVDLIIEDRLRSKMMPVIQGAVEKSLTELAALAQLPDVVPGEGANLTQMSLLKEELNQQFAEDGYGKYGEALLDNVFNELTRSMRLGSFLAEADTEEVVLARVEDENDASMSSSVHGSGHLDDSPSKVHVGSALHEERGSPITGISTESPSDADDEDASADYEGSDSSSER